MRGRLTWRDLDDRITRMSGAIAPAEPPAGPIALALPDRAASVAALYAGLDVGRAVLTLDTSVPLERNLDIIAQARAGAALVDRPNHPLAAHLPVIAIGDGSESPRLRAEQRNPLAPDDIAFIVSTSGSTGRPKLVAHGQRATAWRAKRYVPEMGLTLNDRFISAGFAVSSWPGLIYLSGLLHPGVYAHIAATRALGMRRLFDVMTRERITALQSGASFLRALADLPGARAAFAEVRSIRMAGEPTTWADIDLIRTLARPDCRVANSYGASECTGFFWVENNNRSAHPVHIPAGVPCPECDALIADEDGENLPPGEVGELFARSRYNALGDIVEGRLVQTRLWPDAVDPSRRVYATGDLARRRPDGMIVVLGRKDRVMKINGQRVEPAEVEAAIRVLPGVSDVIVLPKPVRDTHVLIAFVAGATLGEDIVAQTREGLRRRLPDYLVPSRIVVIGELPRLPGGKFDGVMLLASVP